MLWRRTRPLQGKQGLGYVWDVVRVAFLSTLYRFWVRAAVEEASAMHGGQERHAPQNRPYESQRHVIIATIAAVRWVVCVDGRRALESVEHTRASGEQVRETRLRSAFIRSWVACGWGELRGEAASVATGVRCFFTTSFPVAVAVSGLRRPNFGSPGRPTAWGSLWCRVNVHCEKLRRRLL